MYEILSNINSSVLTDNLKYSLEKDHEYSENDDVLN